MEDKHDRPESAMGGVEADPNASAVVPKVAEKDEDIKVWVSVTSLWHKENETFLSVCDQQAVKLRH